LTTKQRMTIMETPHKQTSQSHLTKVAQSERHNLSLHAVENHDVTACKVRLCLFYLDYMTL